MKITAIKQQVKNPERVSISVDDKYGFSLNLSQLLKEKITNGQELDPAALKRLKKISEDGKLKDRALAWILNRPHSVREFQDYLRRKKADPDFADELTQEFISKKYLDDEAYGRWLFEIRTRSGKSNRAITAELAKKGVAKQVADSLLNENVQDERSRLGLLAAKKRRLSRYSSDPQKLAQYLIRQGFSYDLVKEVISGLQEEQ